MGARQVIALASSRRKLELLKSLGAYIAINYSEPSWTDQVRAATGGRGADIVLEAASGEVGRQSFKLVAPFGRLVLFGARNIHDTLSSENIEQLIRRNQCLIGFNLPTVDPQQIAENVPELLRLIAQGKLKMFADSAFPLGEVKKAFEALSSRNTIGKVVLIP